MRIISTLVITIVANFAAGALFAASALENPMAVRMSLIGGGTFLTLLVSGWAIIKFHRSTQRLVKHADTCPADASQTGLVDFDEVSRHYAHVFQQSVAESKELADVKQVILKIDRRQENFDRDGNPIPAAVQLRNVLAVYGGEFDSNVRQTLTCGIEIRRATEELVNGSDAQTNVVNHAASVIEKLITRAQTVCDSAETAMTASNQATTKATNGLQHFEELVDELKQIRNHAATRERKMLALGKHTKEIESIVQTIGTLSSRTDLLALNASIESVRAGEHGRGFAIVAEEVRALAEQSAQAVLGISRLIEMIQLEAHQSISVATGDHDQMNLVISQVTQSLDSLKSICDASNDSSEGLIEISQTTRQQLKMTQELVDSLERSAKTAQENRSRAEGVQWSVKTLAQCGEQFENTLGLFRLANPPGNPRHETAPGFPGMNDATHRFPQTQVFDSPSNATTAPAPVG
ncbi:MAG: methyl-accepting chemotaxis protein [Mariniblastus sp.]|jgi:methyl-accepting chemotaxis protein